MPLKPWPSLDFQIFRIVDVFNLFYMDDLKLFGYVIMKPLWETIGEKDSNSC